MVLKLHISTAVRRKSKFKATGSRDISVDAPVALMVASLPTAFLCGLALFLSQCAPLITAATFVANRTYNLAAYWGQDSVGHQKRLSYYCQDDSIDIIPLAFLPVFFDKGGYPLINFANVCSDWGSNAFAGTNLANCAFLSEDIRGCQSKGKIVTLSLGGPTAKVGFQSDSQAKSFAEVTWNLFLGGSSAIRPFGGAILDGIDLDIESGSGAHYAVFVERVRSLAQGADKRYYVSATPQCPFPDQYIGGALNVARFDFVFVQFYNNYCQLSDPSWFNFATWDHWARNTSPNPDVKVFIGAPGSPETVGQGYVDIETLSNIAQVTQSRYPSFGGVMLWDADAAYSNNKFHITIKKALLDAVPARPGSATSDRPNTRYV
ncbi:chitinase [Amanita rubescens]|nr:chitinase [Amanita rubescens]